MKASTKKTLWILGILALIAGGTYYFTMANGGNTSNANGRGYGRTRRKHGAFRRAYPIFSSPEAALIYGKQDINLGAGYRGGYCGSIPFKQCRAKGFSTCAECRAALG